MTLVIKNVKFLYSALKSMEMIDYECHVKLSSGGMELQGIGPSRISVFKFVLGELGNDFIDFGMDLIDFGKVLERIKNAKEAELSYDSKTRRYKIKAKIKNKTKTFTISEINAELARFPFDNLLEKPYEVAFEMPTNQLVEMLKDGEICSGIVTIGIEDGMLSFTGVGSTGSYFVQLDDHTHTNEFENEYGIAHLLSKIDKMRSYPVSIVLGEGLPIYLNYEFDNGYLKIFVAPRVGDDDEDY